MDPQEIEVDSVADLRVALEDIVLLCMLSLFSCCLCVAATAYQ